MLECSFGSDLSYKINKNIFATIYYASLESSHELSQSLGSFENWKKCDYCNNTLLFDMYNKESLVFNDKYKDLIHREQINPVDVGKLIDDETKTWDALKSKLKKGLRNSLLTAIMPTASSASILGNSESTEPVANCIYRKITQSGQFDIINPYLIKYLEKYNYNQEEIIQEILNNDGVLDTVNINETCKDIFKPIHHINQKNIVRMMIERLPYICQAQSMNLYLDTNNESYAEDLSDLLFLSYFYGGKNGVYYCRTEHSKPQKYQNLKKEEPKNTNQIDLNNKDDNDNDNDKAFECIPCSS